MKYVSNFSSYLPDMICPPLIPGACSSILFSLSEKVLSLAIRLPRKKKAVTAINTQPVMIAALLCRFLFFSFMNLSVPVGNPRLFY